MTSYPPRHPGSRVRRQLAVFYAVAGATLVVLAVVAFFASRTVARNQALDDAMRTTERLGKVVVAPLLGPGLAGDAHKLRDLRSAVQERLKDGFITEVTVWDVNGTVIFSDDPAVEGTRVDPPAEAIAAIREGTTYSNFEDTPEITPATPPGHGDGYVEVYVPMMLTPDRMLALEIYYSYDRVNNAATSILRNILPLVFIPLVLLQVIQVPIAGSLARRVRRQEADRAQLLEQALAMSEIERVRIAADLHDGPIQDLAGVGYALGAIIPSLPPQYRGLASDVGDTVHHAVGSLRQMMVDIYPPDMTTGDLMSTVENLAQPLREDGLLVEVVNAGLPDLDADTITALYRTAREALLNVANHAAATQVWIRLDQPPHSLLTFARHEQHSTQKNGDHRPVVRLVIADNGSGFTPGELDRRAEGHLGLRLLQDRATSMGGVLTVESPPAGGTTVTAVLPARSGPTSS